jgi:hypothetical protein
MGRFSRNSSYGHTCQRIVWYGVFYRISWIVDRYYPGSRLRHPTTFTRDTDEAGARRFCKRWDLEFPEDSKN